MEIGDTVWGVHPDMPKWFQKPVSGKIVKVYPEYPGSEYAIEKETGVFERFAGCNLYLSKKEAVYKWQEYASHMKYELKSDLEALEDLMYNVNNMK